MTAAREWLRSVALVACVLIAYAVVTIHGMIADRLEPLRKPIGPIFGDDTTAPPATWWEIIAVDGDRLHVIPPNETEPVWISQTEWDLIQRFNLAVRPNTEKVHDAVSNPESD